MQTQQSYNQSIGGIAIFAIAVFTLNLTGCGPSPSEQAPTLTTPSEAIPSATAKPLIPLSTISALTESPVATVTALLPVTASTPILTSTWKDGWVDFINGYYGYAVTLPPSAKIIKNDQIYGYSPEEVPADWDQNENYFDYLNRTYPQVCV